MNWELYELAISLHVCGYVFLMLGSVLKRAANTVS
jgi:hypothetical protein